MEQHPDGAGTGGAAPTAQDAEARRNTAEARWHQAREELSEAISQWVAAVFREARGQWPTAAKLGCTGDRGDEEGAVLFAEVLLDAEGEVIADDSDDNFNAMADEVRGHLDWLAEINGDDFYGSWELDLDSGVWERGED